MGLMSFMKHRLLSLFLSGLGLLAIFLGFLSGNIAVLIGCIILAIVLIYAGAYYGKTQHHFDNNGVWQGGHRRRDMGHRGRRYGQKGERRFHR